MLKSTPAEFYIPATESLLERRPRTLKHGNTFGLFDHYGDISLREGNHQEGLYHNDTRYLSGLRLLINGRRPLLLSSKVVDNNSRLSVDLTNPDWIEADRIVLPRDVVHISRSSYLWRNACYERLSLQNFHQDSLSIVVEILFQSDFADIFEVRGKGRAKRGTAAIMAAGDRVTIAYCGLDSVLRRTILNFEPPPTRLDEERATYRLALAPGGRSTVFFSVCCTEIESEGIAPARNFFSGIRQARAELRAATTRSVVVETSNHLFNEVIRRSMADLHMLLTNTEQGPFPYAGIPWFSTNFGRDALISAMEILWIDPAIAKGVLRFLAAIQAKELRPEADAEPGKIIHEIRRGEMARLGEVPFAFYYGSVDSTPLFVLLAGLYFERTGDCETISQLWPHIESALLWIDQYGDRDGDGFIEYFRAGEGGLTNQGWKDSTDSVFHSDGSLAEGPIALCEVQGYVYAAKRHAAKIARILGFSARADELRRQADALKARFDEAFWSDEIRTYALALDGYKKRCDVRSSNAGHLLFCGIAPEARAAQIADQLLSKDFFSGWGVRTIAACERRYNPMSYHNGSVWPHDNALIGFGLARYGLKHRLSTLFSALFESAAYFDLRRFPELFCGFQRLRGKGRYSTPSPVLPKPGPASLRWRCSRQVLGSNSTMQEDACVSVDRTCLLFSTGSLCVR